MLIEPISQPQALPPVPLVEGHAAEQARLRFPLVSAAGRAIRGFPAREQLVVLCCRLQRRVQTAGVEGGVRT